MKNRILVFAVLSSWAWSLPVPAEEPGAPQALIEPGPNLVLDGVPSMPAALMESLRRYQQVRSAGFQDWLPDGSMLITTRFADTAQVHRVYQPGGRREQLTFLPERVAWARACPRPGCDHFLYGRDRGGDEFYQIWRQPLSGGAAVLLTDGSSRHGVPVWDRQGKTIAFSSTRRNGRDFDIYLMDPLQPGQARLLLQVEGLWQPLDFSPDGKTLLVLNYVSVAESHLWLADVSSGKQQRLTPAQESPVAWPAARFSPDGKSIFLLGDRDGEFVQLWTQPYPAKEFQPRQVLREPLSWDVEGFEISPDGRLAALVTNEGGPSRLRFWDLKGAKYLPEPPLEKGVVGAIKFRRDRNELAFDLRGSTLPGDVWSAVAGRREAQRWTFSELGEISAADLIEPRLVDFPTFDEVRLERRRIPAWLYLPPHERFSPPWPVLISFHGGPEAQARPVYQGTINYLVAELGIAMLVPNLRGSTGYGKTYATLDNGRLRENVLRDVDALMEWLGAEAELDASRVAVNGGSYGGFLSLISLARYGEKLKCGTSYVGISNFVTFLENTQPYRQDLRRQEYGDERVLGTNMFLEMISPLSNAGKIRSPLLVLQGARDPRVPASEAEQMVAKVREKGGEVWYVLARDEGHGFVKKQNSDFASLVSTRFLEKCLLNR